MKKMKKNYTSPVIQRATVELEGGFCGSVVEDSKAGYATVTSSAQEYDSFENCTTKGADEDIAAITWD